MSQKLKQNIESPSFELFFNKILYPQILKYKPTVMFCYIIITLAALAGTAALICFNLPYFKCYQEIEKFIDKCTIEYGLDMALITVIAFIVVLALIGFACVSYSYVKSKLFPIILSYFGNVTIPKGTFVTKEIVDLLTFLPQHNESYVSFYFRVSKEEYNIDVYKLLLSSGSKRRSRNVFAGYLIVYMTTQQFPVHNIQNDFYTTKGILSYNGKVYAAISSDAGFPELFSFPSMKKKKMLIDVKKILLKTNELLTFIDLIEQANQPKVL